MHFGWLWYFLCLHEELSKLSFLKPLFLPEFNNRKFPNKISLVSLETLNKPEKGKMERLKSLHFPKSDIFFEYEPKIYDKN
jgi:hypothetical protein